MNSLKTLRAAYLTALTCSLTFASLAEGQLTVFYTHTSGPSGDGFIWDEPGGGPNDVLNGDTFITPDGINYGNFSENTTFFDDNYLAAGNSSVINGDAWWGNPLDNGFSQLELGFFNLPEGGVQSVDFDFSWAIAGQDAPDSLEVQIFGFDIEGNSTETFLFESLSETFNAGGAFGGFDGAAGSVSLNAADLSDDNSGEQFDLIEDVFVTVADIATLGGTSEFAIDNVSVNGSGGAGSNLIPFSTFSNSEIGGISTNRLRGSEFDTNVGFDVKNDGTGPTSLSVTLDGSSAPEYIPGSPASGLPVSAGEVVNTGIVATLSSNELSGTYDATINVINDLNGSDPTENLPYTVTIYDPPSLSDNSGTTVQVDVDPVITITNAAAGPHPGAERAGVEVKGISTIGPFTLSGLAFDDFLAPGGLLDGVVAFNRFGQLSKTHNGTATVDLEMNSAAGSFLNGAEAVPSINWNLAFDLTDTASDSVTLAASDSYSLTVGVNTALSALTIVDGESPSAQTVTMDIVPNSGTNGLLGSDAVDVQFSNSSGLYVLQFTFDAGQLPGGISENDLRVLVLDEGTNLWDEAILDNSDGGVGGSLFLGTFGAYLSGPGGGTLDAGDLSAFGVDSATGRAWAVLDHASIFALGVLQPNVPGDTDGDGDVDLVDLDTLGANFGAMGQPGGASIGDFDGDGDVDLVDLDTLGANFGAGTATAVPEPACVALLIAAMMWRCRMRH